MQLRGGVRRDNRRQGKQGWGRVVPEEPWMQTSTSVKGKKGRQTIQRRGGGRAEQQHRGADTGSKKGLRA